MAKKDKEIYKSQADADAEAELLTNSSYEVYSFEPLSYDELEAAFGDMFKEILKKN